MAKERNPYDINWTMFFIVGTLLLSVISGLKYLSGHELAFQAVILTFIFGGFVGHLAITKHTSLIKNLAFFFIIGYILWTIFTPIDIVGDNIIIERTEFAVLIGLGILFLEREILNSIRRLFNKPQTLIPGVLGIVAISFLWLPLTGLVELFTQYYWVWGIVIIIILFRASGLFKKLLDRIVKALEG